MDIVTAPKCRALKAIFVHRARMTLAGVLALALATCASACSSGQESEFDYLRLQIAGQPTLTISKKNTWIRGVIVFFHGPNEDEFTMASSDPYREMSNTLLDAGFAIVSSKAGGNDFDNPGVVDMYRQVSLMALQNFRIGNLFFLSQSSGVVPALKLLASGYSHLRGLAAIRPVTNGDPLPLSEDSSQSVGANHLSNRNIRLYVSADGAQAVTNGEASTLADQLGKSANVSVVPCSEEHGGSSCLQGNDLARWFTSLDKAN